MIKKYKIGAVLILRPIYFHTPGHPVVSPNIIPFVNVTELTGYN